MYKEAVEKEIEIMLKEGIVEPPNIEWVSPMVMIKKKDDTICLCVDYRKLNAMTQVDAYPMPQIDLGLGGSSQIHYYSWSR